MKRSKSGSACPISSQRHLEAVSPPSMLQHTMAFSSRRLLLLSMGHTLHTCTHTHTDLGNSASDRGEQQHADHFAALVIIVL